MLIDFQNPFVLALAIFFVSIFSIGLVPVKVISSKTGEKYLSIYSTKLEEGLSSETLTPFCFKFLFIVKNTPALTQGYPNSFFGS